MTVDTTSPDTSRAVCLLAHGLTFGAALQSLLGEPNNESPLNVHAAQLWSNQKAFRSMVTAHSPVPIARAEK